MPRSAHLSPDTLDTVVAVAELPDLVRGYESIKLANVARYRRPGRPSSWLEMGAELPAAAGS